MPVDRLKYVVDRDLCARCGTCAGVCPAEAITLDSSNYPIINSSCIECGKCLKVCPGIDVHFPELTMQLFKKEFEMNNVLGFFSNAYAGYALNSNVRANASSGGVITQLLIYLLEKKIISGAIVTIMNPDAPCKSMAILAKTKDELLQSMQSRYSIVPVNQIFREIKQMEGKFALVGLPCHIHAFRKLANIDNSLTDKIYITLGLFCQMNLEPEGTIAMQKVTGIIPGKITNFEYRGGMWPGVFRITLKDGTMHNLHYSNFKDGAYNYLSRLYYAKRCLYCIDGSAELADISFADPWIQDKSGKWTFKGGWTLIFQRTEIGREILLGAAKDNAIFIEELYDHNMFNRFINNISNKRNMAFVRLSKLKNKSKPAPEYHLGKISFSADYKRKEFLFSVTLIFSRYTILKDVIMKILFSRIGVLLTKSRIKLKYKTNINKYKSNELKKEIT